MKLSLSAGIVELDLSRGLTEMAPADSIRFAGEAGYDGVGIRPSHVTPNSPEGEIEALQSARKRLGFASPLRSPAPVNRKGRSTPAPWIIPRRSLTTSTALPSN